MEHEMVQVASLLLSQKGWRRRKMESLRESAEAEVWCQRGEAQTGPGTVAGTVERNRDGGRDRGTPCQEFPYKACPGAKFLRRPLEFGHFGPSK